ncbi:MAG: hypothetical protein AAF721_20085 [Myxococcota bacterium]
MRWTFIAATALALNGCAEDDKSPPPINEIEDSGNVSGAMTQGQATAGSSSGASTGAGGTADDTTSGGPPATGPGDITGSSTGGTTAGDGLPGMSSDDGSLTTDQIPD